MKRVSRENKILVGSIVLMLLLSIATSFLYAYLRTEDLYKAHFYSDVKKLKKDINNKKNDEDKFYTLQKVSKKSYQEGGIRGWAIIGDDNKKICDSTLPYFIANKEDGAFFKRIYALERNLSGVSTEQLNDGIYINYGIDGGVEIYSRFIESEPTENSNRAYFKLEFNDYKTSEALFIKGHNTIENNAEGSIFFPELTEKEQKKYGITTYYYDKSVDANGEIIKHTDDEIVALHNLFSEKDLIGSERNVSNSLELISRIELKDNGKSYALFFAAERSSFLDTLNSDTFFSALAIQLLLYFLFCFVFFYVRRRQKKKEKEDMIHQEKLLAEMMEDIIVPTETIKREIKQLEKGKESSLSDAIDSVVFQCRTLINKVNGFLNINKKNVSVLGVNIKKLFRSSSLMFVTITIIVLLVSLLYVYLGYRSIQPEKMKNVYDDMEFAEYQAEEMFVETNNKKFSFSRFANMYKGIITKRDFCEYNSICEDITNGYSWKDLRKKGESFFKSFNYVTGKKKNITGVNAYLVFDETGKLIHSEEINSKDYSKNEKIRSKEWSEKIIKYYAPDKTISFSAFNNMDYVIREIVYIKTTSGHPKLYNIYLIHCYDIFKEMVKADDFRYSIIIAIINSVLLCIAISLIVAEIRRRQTEAAKSKMLFVSAITHDLKTPITVIMNRCEVLKEGMVAEKEKEYLESIYNQTERILSLQKSIHTYYELTDASNIEKAKCDLVSIIDQSKNQNKEFACMSEKDILVSSDVDVAAIMANERLILLAINNYIVNALKYSVPNERVIVTLNEVKGKFKVSVVNKAYTRNVGDPKKWWEIMFREDEARSNTGQTGMGLPVCRRIFEAHGYPYGASVKNNEVEMWFECPKAKVSDMEKQY